MLDLCSPRFTTSCVYTIFIYAIYLYNLIYFNKYHIYIYIYILNSWYIFYYHLKKKNMFSLSSFTIIFVHRRSFPSLRCQFQDHLIMKNKIPLHPSRTYQALTLPTSSHKRGCDGDGACLSDLVLLYCHS